MTDLEKINEMIEMQKKLEAQIKATEEARTFGEIYGWWDYDIEELEDD